MAAGEAPATSDRAVFCAVCHEQIAMPGFVILQGAVMCAACERVQAPAARQ
jgi:hypothetical protein